jgi:two-component system chemotaxis sensor kinase CheA
MPAAARGGQKKNSEAQLGDTGAEAPRPGAAAAAPGEANPAEADAASAAREGASASEIPAARAVRSAVDPPRPPANVRVRTEVLDRFLTTVGEVILSSNQLRTAAARRGQAPARFESRLDRMDRVVGELQRRALELRTTRLERIVEPLPRVARDLAQRLGKRVEVEICDADVELDRQVLDRLSDPLVHVIRNAVDHGIEAPSERRVRGKSEVGHIRIDAARERDTIRIGIRDDGRGIDLDRVRARAIEAGLVIPDLAVDLPPEEVVAFVFHPGLSTAKQISDVSGRGVGMDAVRSAIEALGGHVELRSDVGRGTAIELVVPVTAAVQRVLIVDVGNARTAIPVVRVERIVEVRRSEVEVSAHEAFALVDGVPLPIFFLDQAIVPASAAQRVDDTERDVLTLLLTDVRGERVGLCVDRVRSQEQIFVKPVPPLFEGLRALAGLTLLGDGRPIFVLDLNQLVTA